MTAALRTDLLLAIAWLACLVVFVALAIHVSARNDDVDRISPPVDAIEVDIARAVQDLPSALGDVLDAVNRVGYGSPLTLITAVAMIAFCLRRRPLEAALLLLTLAPRILQTSAKVIVQAPRPTADLVDVHRAIGGFAYPSGHVVSTTVVFVLLFVFTGRLRLGRLPTLAIQGVAVFMVVSVSFARVWAGAHWPSDCIGGYLFAALFLIPVLRLHAALSRRTKSSTAAM